jgi:hypothetical protein
MGGKNEWYRAMTRVEGACAVGIGKGRGPGLQVGRRLEREHER